MTYPGNYKTECTVPKASAGKVEITCVLSESISGYIMIEQRVIGCGLGEITIASFKSPEEIKWTKDEVTDEVNGESDLANGTETEKSDLTNGTSNEESDLANGTETEKTDVTSEISTNDTSEEIISPEEAEKKMNASLSFRQINQFVFNPTSHFITFNFYGITTQPIIASYQFIIELYLILSGGVMDTILSEATCTLDQAVDPDGKQAQADFSCKIPDLDETKTYESFELYDSEDIVGIPDDEVLLNPVKTQEAIEAH